jgi:hypothetical protein
MLNKKYNCLAFLLKIMPVNDLNLSSIFLWFWRKMYSNVWTIFPLYPWQIYFRLLILRFFKLFISARLFWNCRNPRSHGTRVTFHILLLYIYFSPFLSKVLPKGDIVNHDLRRWSIFFNFAIFFFQVFLGWMTWSSFKRLKDWRTTSSNVIRR